MSAGPHFHRAGDEHPLKPDHRFYVLRLIQVHCIFKVGQGEIRPIHICISEVCSFKNGIGEIGGFQLRIGKIGTHQVEVGQI